jgi:GNAT superfamily N-acetyltransferase
MFFSSKGSPPKLVASLIARMGRVPQRETIQTTRTHLQESVQYVEFEDKVYLTSKLGFFEWREEVSLARYRIVVAAAEVAEGECFDVSKEFQGKGEGRRLMQEVEDRLCARGVTSITAGVLSGSEGFYEACGFVPIPNVHLNFRKELDCAAVKQSFTDAIAPAAIADV